MKLSKIIQPIKQIKLFFVSTLFAILAVLVMFSTSWAATYYVATNGNDSNTGVLSASWKTVQKAAATAEEGDTVYFRGGAYTGNLEPANDGSSGHYITFIAYPGETPTITHALGGNEEVVRLNNRDYIIIDGFTLDGNNTGGWVSGYQSGNYNIIRNNTMVNCKKSRHGVLVTTGTHWKIQNNTMTHGTVVASQAGTDAIKVYGSGYHLIEGNHITNAEHSAVYVGGSNIVVRNNWLYNDYNQVINSGQVTGDKKILIENNTIIGAGSVPRDAGFSQGIQLMSQQTVIRHNIIYGTYSAGISLECYMADSEAEDVNGDRIYNNTIFNTHDGGIRIQRRETGAVMSDNVFKNNIVRKTYRAQTSTNYQQVYWLDYSNGETDADYAIESAIVAFNNFSASTAAPEDIAGWTSDDGPAVEQNLAYMHTNYASYFSDNLEVVPLFSNEDGNNFNLMAASPMIDAGTNLTLANGAGSESVTLIVDDAKYFSDGFGVPDVDADWIRIGSNTIAQVSSINYGTETITLTSAQSWSDNDSINLYKDSSGNIVLSGSNPDIGAFEYAVPLAAPAEFRFDSTYHVAGSIPAIR